ncbi:hypothetical protein CN354_23285 [Bacillus cereus]|nr:hypothetical protein CN354_23285 [Bacillus cereus]
MGTSWNVCMKEKRPFPRRAFFLHDLCKSGFYLKAIKMLSNMRNGGRSYCVPKACILYLKQQIFFGVNEDEPIFFYKNAWSWK